MSEEHIPGGLDDTDNNDFVQVDPEESGPLQKVSTASTTSSRKTQDVAYRQASRTVEESLAAGLSNEDVWMLIRRFNKQIYYVKAADNPAGSDLDLNRAEDEQFPPQKLRITLERFYTSVIVGITALFSHIARLRSWKEPRRTASFCGVYFAALFLDCLIPVIVSTLIALALSRSVRPILFPLPPAPPLDPASDDGEIQNQLHDSITGAPEAHKGEAAEQEAKNFVNSVANIAMESAAAKYGQTVMEPTPEEPSPPEPPILEPTTPETPGENGAPVDKTKKPMKKKIANGTDQTMRILSDITDIYEKFANVFSPTPPFTMITARMRLVGILVAVLVASRMASGHMIVKGGAFAAGLGFFGDPVFSRTLDILNAIYPNWKEQLDLQKTLLKGVPNNAQLTLTLLRIGELNGSPLPPPPSPQDGELDWPLKKKKPKALPSSASTTSLDKTTSLDRTSSTDLQRQQTPASTAPPKEKRRLISKILRFVRRTISTAIKGHMAFDRAMTIAGNAHTRNLIGMLQKRGWVSAPHGPLKFEAKFERKRGAAVIDSTLEPPVLYFTTTASGKLDDDLRLESRKESSVLFQMPVTEIRELKKTEGLRWKSKMIVELTAGSKEAADGLIVSGTEPERSFHLTGMRSRNQLFNRLVAIDAQFWESR
ncbi:hypothetical protein P168DRAFT_293026 [Aspergillus campestris IBT 28561]|uniref:Uncharacterized protein n=1 Tax=Aspergillus campestris (strain IBT 28561) TaxID=1392248 RepID=A0A2I1CUA2_ASPC2|nr:uncharacterized protein P168DRAFT_293026 [Aspergillus campestris IBT 28561]PKY01189.1 hypothetical protein P168DRAFT_293026 [Aspergillus campestris IBT 28561]